MDTAFAVDAGGFGAAEGGSQVAEEPAVDPTQPDFDFGGEAAGPVDVLGVDRGGQPYFVSFAMAMASASVSNGWIWQQGPKISSCTTDAVSGSPVQMVGCTQQPSLRSSGMSGMPPPKTMVAPSSLAFW